MERVHKLPPHQIRFQKEKGTNEASTHLVSVIELEFGKKHKILSIFIDIESAYDTIQLDSLLNQMNKANIPVRNSSLILNFLNNILIYLKDNKNSIWGPQPSQKYLYCGDI